MFPNTLQPLICLRYNQVVSAVVRHFTWKTLHDSVVSSSFHLCNIWIVKALLKNGATAYLRVLRRFRLRKLLSQANATIQQILSVEATPSAEEVVGLCSPTWVIVMGLLYTLLSVTCHRLLSNTLLTAHTGARVMRCSDCVGYGYWVSRKYAVPLPFISTHRAAAPTTFI